VGGSNEIPVSTGIFFSPRSLNNLFDYNINLYYQYHSTSNYNYVQLYAVRPTGLAVNQVTRTRLKFTHEPKGNAQSLRSATAVV
jgi:hypothetical protein